MSDSMSTATTAYDLEYRVEEDDAWYSVGVNLSEDGTRLAVIFQGFDAWNKRISAGQFKCAAQVDRFLERFRPASKQLQDNECDKVIKGRAVCAALSYRTDDLRFYDAVVEDVERQEHSTIDGEEECLCSFMLCWLHGPMSGNISLVKIGNICAIQTAAFANPGITTFSKLTKERIPAACSKSCVVSKHCAPEVGFGESLSCKECICFSLSEKSSSERILQDSKGESYCRKRRKGKERFSLTSHRGSDEDLGGTDSVNSGGCYFVLIDNLEKDLSTSAIRQFIRGQTLVSPRAYLFPSSPSVRSVIGAIASHSKESIEKIYDFLVQPEHLIVSARGRPWVVYEKVWDGSCGATLGSLLSQSQDEFQLPNLKKELKVVQFGTEAYNAAKQLRDLFLDFLDHEQLLHQRLASKETEILECHLN